jgi:hypothetical protein
MGAARQRKLAGKPTRLEERNSRWGIVAVDKGGWLYQLIDRKKAWNDGDNFMALSKEAIDWLDQQPETRIPGVIEMLNVHLASHRTGIVGGFGSEQLDIATAAMERETGNFTEEQTTKTMKAVLVLFQRGKKQWPDSKFTLPPEPAATLEEIVDFYAKMSPSVSAAVN